MNLLKRLFAQLLPGDATPAQESHSFCRCDVCGKAEWVRNGDYDNWFFEQLGQGTACRSALFCGKKCQERYHKYAKWVDWRIVHITWKDNQEQVSETAEAPDFAT